MTEPENTNNTGSLPETKLEGKLIELFTVQLNVPSIGIHDDFFQIGGNHQLSAMLIQDVNKTFGLDLQLDDFITHNTIAKLAKLAQKGSTRLNSHIIPLNKSRDKPPLFFICGIVLYGPLAKNLKDAYSCYGVFVPEEESFINSQGNGSKTPIPDLAAMYVTAIQAHTPTGPYTIAGVSFGGILAFEIARQLKHSAEDVSGLIILDAVLPGAMQRDWMVTFKIILAKLKTLIFKTAFKHFGNLINNTRSKSNSREDKNMKLLQILRGKTVKRYFRNEPTFSEPTLIVRASDQGRHQLAPDLCWAPKLKGPVIIAEAPGSHLEIIGSKATAELIVAYIQTPTITAPPAPDS